MKKIITRSLLVLLTSLSFHAHAEEFFDSLGPNFEIITSSGNKIALPNIIFSDDFSRDSIENFVSTQLKGELLVKNPDNLDRHSRILSDIGTKNNPSLEESLVSKGFAFAFAKTPADCKRLKSLEKTSLKPIVDLASTPKRYGRFVIIQSHVAKIIPLKNKSLIKIGGPNRSDFTLILNKAENAKFRKAKLKINDLEGKRVEIRGIIGKHENYEIELFEPCQITAIDKQA